MNKIKRIGYPCAIFVAGGVAAINLSVMKYGVPEHYDAHWGKVIFAVFLAVVFGYLATNDSPDKSDY